MEIDGKALVSYWRQPLRMCDTSMSINGIYGSPLSSICGIVRKFFFRDRCIDKKVVPEPIRFRWGVFFQVLHT